VLDYCREGDALVVWKLDRLGRSLRELIDLVNGLKDRWPDPVFCTKRYESVSTDSNSSVLPPSSTLLSRPTPIANSAGVR
jgi:DNA invertase Pin-like site-specific DNA recombinase